jgi:outer membrane protein OmpA-like peptidoglycan-associated protein
MKFSPTFFKLSIVMSLIILQCFSLNAQKKGKGDKTKLFLNFTFEDLKEDGAISEPSSISMLKNVGSPTSIGADIFNSNSPGDFGTGQNIYGKEDPITASFERLTDGDKNLFDPELKGGGEGFAGIVIYKPGKLAKERSYITIPFMSGKNKILMTKGMKYCVEFSISLAESSKYASNNIQMLFDTGYDIESNKDEVLGFVSKQPGRTLSNYKNKIYSDFYGWEKVCAMYESKDGKETCIIIGNFETNDETKVEVQKKPKDSETEVLPHAYYFIDNVRIKEVKDKVECNCYVADTVNIADSYSTLIFDKTPILNDKMTINQKIQAQVAYFGFGKKSYTPSGKEAFNFIIAAMKKDPKIGINIIGHNDEKEDELADQNQELVNMARQRAEAIKSYFEREGISEERIKVSANGAKVNSIEIQSDDDNEVRDAKNRRVMFEVFEVIK